MFKVASSDLINMGINVVSYTLKDVHDDQVCLPSLHFNTSSTDGLKKKYEYEPLFC